MRIRPICSAPEGFYFQASTGSVALPVAGYDYNSDWTPLLAGLSPAEMAASLAAPEPFGLEAESTEFYAGTARVIAGKQPLSGANHPSHRISPSCNLTVHRSKMRAKNSRAAKFFILIARKMSNPDRNSGGGPDGHA